MRTNSYHGGGCVSLLTGHVWVHEVGGKWYIPVQGVPFRWLLGFTSLGGHQRLLVLQFVHASL